MKKKKKIWLFTKISFFTFFLVLFGQNFSNSTCNKNQPYKDVKKIYRG